jgi:hypothetical protein
MSQIVPTKKLYHDHKGKLSLIRDVNRLSTGGQTIPINNDIIEPFDRGGNKPLGGSGNGPLGGGGNKHLGNQNPRPYATRLAMSWIGPT